MVLWYCGTVEYAGVYYCRVSYTGDAIFGFIFFLEGLENEHQHLQIVSVRFSIYTTLLSLFFMPVTFHSRSQPYYININRTKAKYFLEDERHAIPRSPSTGFLNIFISV